MKSLVKYTFIAAILFIGILGFSAIHLTDATNWLHWVGVILTLPITIPCIIYWADKIENLFKK